LLACRKKHAGREDAPGYLMGECPQMTTEVAAGPEPQAVAAPLTGAAIFLVVTIEPGAESDAAVCDLLSDLPGLLRAAGFRDLDAHLSCVVGIGSQAHR
jgi:hypothetical protein